MNSDLKTRVASILKIENSAAWEITDEAEDLVNVHYIRDRYPGEFCSLRGVVVDTKDRKVVADSYGYTPVAEVDKLTHGITTVTDKDDIKHDIDLSKVKIRYSWEGTIIRAFRWKGRTFFASHRKLNVDRSRWGGSKTFSEIYTELNGPKEGDLFDLSKPSSVFCHFFLLVHKDLQVVSKLNFKGPGFIAYLGYRSQDNRDNNPDIDQELKIPSNVVTTIPEEWTIPFVYCPPYVTIEEANRHLLYGFWEPHDIKIDSNLGLGESLIVYKEDGTVLKLESKAYSFRASVRSDESNLKCSFYRYLTRAIFPEKFPETLRVPYFPSKEIIANEEIIIVWPEGQKAKLDTREQRVENIWRLFLNIVPFHRQKEVKGFLQAYKDDKRSVANWLCQQINEGKTIQNQRAEVICTIAKQAKKGEDVNLRDVIEGLLCKENGGSFYKIMKDMKKSIRQDSLNKESL